MSRKGVGSRATLAGAAKSVLVDQAESMLLQVVTEKLDGLQLAELVAVALKVGVTSEQIKGVLVLAAEQVDAEKQA